MLIVRRVKETDLEPLYTLIGQSELGLTTLTISKQKLQDRIEQSVFAFNRDMAKPDGQPYVFVMEDVATGQLVGTAAIYSKVGGFEPFYSYRIKNSVHESSELNVHKEIQVLHLNAEHNGPTEIGSLFLAPDYWGGGHGRVLSLTRFLFMAEFPDRFEREVIAEMRGVVQPDGKSAFWSAIGSHFFQIDFPRAETLTSQSKKFIADLMPKHPIYIPLLSKEAQDVIGRVHRNTEPAKALLEKEGFEFRNFVDIFDGGPTLHCERTQIRAVRDSRNDVVANVVDDLPLADDWVIASAGLDFRCCLGSVEWTETGAVLDKATATGLSLKQGDRLRTVKLRPAN